MFNTMEIAKHIRQARIEKNMTQMNLADAMGVSYQAVSNWERGNSLPDIAKLEDLCGVLEISVTDLLGMENGAAVDKAIQQEDLTLEELSRVAPMLPPKQVQEQAEKAKQKKKLNVSAIIGLAPFLDEEYLAKLVEDAEAEDLSQVMALAPFLDEETLEILVSRCEQEADIGTICGLAPFLSEQTLDALVERVLEGDHDEDFECLSGLYPFLSKQTLWKIAEKLMEKHDPDALGNLMPFV